MHRLMAETAALGEERPVLSHEAANHLKVLRPKDGEEIELFDGRGSSRVYRYSRAGEGLVARGEAATSAPRPAPLVLFACVTKGSRWDWTIEKATELGATKIVPVLSERTVVRVAPQERAAKRGRWMRGSRTRSGFPRFWSRFRLQTRLRLSPRQTAMLARSQTRRLSRCLPQLRSDGEFLTVQNVQIV